MPNKATVHLLGHAGRDGEQKYTQGGTPYLSFALATNKWQPGEQGDIVTWWQITLWGQRAERQQEWGGVAKGDAVYVEGEPYLEEWTDQAGSKRVTLKVRAEDVIVLKRAADRDDAPADTGPLVDTYVPF